MKENLKNCFKYWIIPLLVEYAIIILLSIIKSSIVSNLYIVFSIITKIVFICKYLILRFLKWKSIENKFRLFIPISFIILAVYIMLSVTLSVLVDINIMIKTVVSVIVFVSIVTLLTASLGSFIKNLKITETDNGVFLLSITVSSTMIYIEESIYELIIFGDYLKSLLLIITSLVWIFYLIYDNICVERKLERSAKYYSTLILQILVTIGINIFTIYELFHNETNLFNGILAVYASLVGGSLTLAGVAWTINHSNAQRKEDKILENKPLFFPLMLNQQELKSRDLLEIAFVKTDEKNAKVITIGVLENSDNSIIIIDKIVINKKEYIPLNNKVISKSKKYKIFISTNEDLLKEDIVLVVKDVLGNEYLYEIDVVDLGDNEKKYNNILSVKEIHRTIR